MNLKIQIGRNEHEIYNGGLSIKVRVTNPFVSAICMHFCN